MQSNQIPVVVDENELTKVVTKQLELGLYPQYIGKEKSAVNKLLRQRKFKYNPDLNGILLNFNHLKFLTNTGRIIDDGPFIFWTVKANFQIFNVTIDQLVRSKINRIGKKYLGCIMANCIDVTIQFDPEVEMDIEQNLVPHWKVGDDIVFKVKSFTPSNSNLIYIEGLIDAEVYQLLLSTTRDNNDDNQNTMDTS